jgi:hypothetical protein
MDTSTKTTGRVTPWNKGKLLGQKLPLKLKEIWAIRIRLQMNHRTRELALFNLAIDSKLRGCDLVGLRVHDVAQGSHVAARAIVMPKKTQRPVQFELTEQTRDAVAAWVAAAHLKPEQFLFPSRVSASPHLSTRQYSRIVGAWVRSIGLDPASCGTHSMRRTKPTLIYRRTKNLRAVQLLLGHTIDWKARSGTSGSRSTTRRGSTARFSPLPDHCRRVWRTAPALRLRNTFQAAVHLMAEAQGVARSNSRAASATRVVKAAGVQHDLRAGPIEVRQSRSRRMRALPIGWRGDW